MKKFFNCLKYEFKRMLTQPEFYGVLLISVLVPVIVFDEPRYYFLCSLDIFAPSPEQTSLLYFNVYGRLFYQFICPMLASIPVACSYFREKQCNQDTMLIASCGRGNYIGAKALMTFLSGFFMAALPFLVNMLLSWIAFPKNELNVFWYPELYGTDFWRALAGSPTGELLITHPALNWLVHIAFIGLWGAGAALLTLGISFFFRKHYILNLLLSTVILIFVSTVLAAAELQAFNPIEYFTLSNYDVNYDPGIYDKGPELSLSALAASFGVLYGACAAFIAAHLVRHRDVI